MSTHTRVTMREIAAAAGLSHASVSLALRNHPSIPPATRERIKILAQKMGYERDPMLSSLNVYRQKQTAPKYRATLAWLNIWPGLHDLETMFEFLDFRAGTEIRCREFGYVLEDFWLYESGMTPAKLARILGRRQIQGVFLPPAPNPEASLDFPWGNFSVVAFGFSFKPIFHLVANAQHRSSRTAFSTLRELGYRRVGFLSLNHISDRTDYNFYAGYVAEAAQMDLPAIIFSLRREDELSSGKKAFLDWFAREKPDAILVPSVWYGRWIMEQIRLDVPGQVAVAVLSVSKNESHFAGILQSSFEIGMAGADELIGLITRNERGVPSHPLRILVEGGWKHGPSAPARIA